VMAVRRGCNGGDRRRTGRLATQRAGFDLKSAAAQAQTFIAALPQQVFGVTGGLEHSLDLLGRHATVEHETLQIGVDLGLMRLSQVVRNEDDGGAADGDHAAHDKDHQPRILGKQLVHREAPLDAIESGALRVFDGQVDFLKRCCMSHLCDGCHAGATASRGGPNRLPYRVLSDGGTRVSRCGADGGANSSGAGAASRF
jgi:hypothetical protein